jgi:hypothetical protein
MRRLTHPDRIRRRDDFWTGGDARGREAESLAAPHGAPSDAPPSDAPPADAPKPALPFLDGSVAEVDGRPELRTRFRRREETTWSLEPAVEAAWLQARTEPRIGVVYRRAGDPF